MSHVATYALLLFCAFLHYTWCSGLVPASNNSNLPASNPTHGANMGWHQDGYNQGVYIAHYYLIGDNCEVENTAMDWFEIALPPPLPATDGDVGENYSVELLNGVLDQARIHRISPRNFVAFAFKTPAQQRLVVFEDVECYHRTPLTANVHAGNLQRQRRRPIARFVFYGVRDDGQPAGFGAETVLVSEPTVVTPHDDMCTLPSGLLQAVKSFAERAGHEKSFNEALVAYMTGTQEVVRWLRCGSGINNPG